MVTPTNRAGETGAEVPGQTPRQLRRVSSILGLAQGSIRDRAEARYHKYEDAGAGAAAGAGVGEGPAKALKKKKNQKPNHGSPQVPN